MVEMKRIIKILLLFILTVVPVNIHALYYCPYETASRLKSLAANITTSYDYEIVGEHAVFTITFANFYKDLIIRDVTNNTLYYPDTSKDMSELTLTGFQDGQTYQFEVYTGVTDCTEEVLFVIYVNLPTYNPYYQESVCSDIPDYSLCQRWSNHGLTREAFINQVTRYKESLNQEPVDDNTEDDGSDIPYILEFYLNYYYIILPLIILGGGYIIYYNRKKDTFGF